MDRETPIEKDRNFRKKISAFSNKSRRKRGNISVLDYQIAKKFSKDLKKKFNAEKVILFGSRARGDHYEKSDFDFLVTSKNFSVIPIIFRMSKLYDFWKEKYDLEVLCYTPEEFRIKEKQNGIVRK